MQLNGIKIFGLTLTGSLALCLAATLPPSPVEAQSSLDAELTRLLRNDCDLLRGGDPVTDFGAQLAQICADGGPSPGGGVSGGGSAVTSPSRRLLDDMLLSYRTSDDGEPSVALGFATLATKGDREGWGGGGSFVFGGSLERVDHSGTEFDLAYDGTGADLFFGAEWQIEDRMALGVGVGYGRMEADQVGGGGFDTTSVGPTVFGVYRPNDRFYLGGALSFRWIEQDRDRVIFYDFDPTSPTVQKINGRAKSSLDTREWSASVQTGYAYRTSGFEIVPRVGLSYRHARSGSSRERGYSDEDEIGQLSAIDLGGPTGLELFYPGHTRESLEATIGLATERRFRASGNLLTARLSADYHHEFMDDAQILTATLLQDGRSNPRTLFYKTSGFDESYVTIGASLDMDLRSGLTAYVGVGTVLGHDYIDQTVVQFGMRAISF